MTAPPATTAQGHVIATQVTAAAQNAGFLHTLEQRVQAAELGGAMVAAGWWENTTPAAKMKVGVGAAFVAGALYLFFHKGKPT